MITLETILASWHQFFFEPTSVYPIAFFRICFGCVLLIDAIYLASNARLYLGPDGLVRYRGYFKSAWGRSLSLFLHLPPTMRSVRLILALHFAAVILLIIGLVTPLAATVVFVTTRSLVSRGGSMTNGGDVVAKTLCFFLIFAPAGHALSADYLVFHASRSGGGEILAAPWAQRLMQIQLCILYFNSAYWKLRGSTWRQGTAVYYACSTEMYRLFKMPAIFLTTPTVQIMTWGVLALEFALAPGLWIEDLRPWCIASAVFLHLGLGIFLNIHLFSFYMIAALTLFLDPSSLERLLSLG